MKKNEKGFSVLEIIIVLIVVGLIGVAGYMVYKNHNRATDTSATTTNTTTTKPNTSTPTTPTDDPGKWYLYTSKDGTYKVRLADGLTFIGSDDSTAIYTVDRIALGTTPAKVVIQNIGHEAPGGLFINYFAKSSDALVSGDKQTGFKTNAGLDVEKYYYYQATEPEGLGLSKGGKEYTYRIINDGKALRIDYDIDAGQAANTDLVEKMVKTVAIN
jgi:prepilin-type N-terminal cleavage/methylation domain-containing protein